MSHLKDSNPHLFELAMTHDTKDVSVAGWFKGLGSGASRATSVGQLGGMWDTLKTGATKAMSALRETEKFLDQDAAMTLAQDNKTEKLTLFAQTQSETLWHNEGGNKFCKLVLEEQTCTCPSGMDMVSMTGGNF